jgi:hypothetical protein
MPLDQSALTDIRSITVHPAELLVHFEADAVSQTPINVSEGLSEQEVMTANDLTEIDAVMQKFAIEGLSDEDGNAIEVDKVTVRSGSSNGTTAAEEEHSAAVFAAGIAMLGLTARRRREEQN